MKRNKVLDLCLCAAMVALHVVLELFCTIRIGNEIKITFATLPFLIAGMLLGPVCGLATGFVGTFLSQMLTYGFTASTIFWILPGTFMGLSAGLFYKGFHRRPEIKSVAATSAASYLILVIFNFIASYFDGVVIFKYMTLEALLALIPFRLITWICMSIIYTLIALPLARVLQKHLHVVM